MMGLRKFESFDDVFCGVCADLLVDDPGLDTDPRYLSSPRGQECREMLAYGFQLKNPRHRVLSVEARKFSVEYLAAELIWYFAGDNTSLWIARHAKFWDHIKNPDGTLNSAYGDRIFNRGIVHRNDLSPPKLKNQWDMVLDELRKDPDSRRAVIHIRELRDGFDLPDVPCTLALQFLLREGKLNLVVHMRSNDIVLGTCYDVPAFTIMQEVMANDLGVELGSYFHFTNSMHVYERHYEMADAARSISCDDLGAHGPMEPLGRRLTIDVLREVAGEMLRWDINTLDYIAAQNRDSPEEMIQQLDAELHTQFERVSHEFLRDLGTLLVTSRLKRAAKEAKREGRDGVYDVLMMKRSTLLETLRDPALKACAR